MPSKYDIAPLGGLCNGLSTELWFPVVKKGGVSAQERDRRKKNDDFVRETCQKCDVKIHCLEYSLLHEPFGTWGGKTELERSEIRASRGMSTPSKEVDR